MKGRVQMATILAAALSAAFSLEEIRQAHQASQTPPRPPRHIGEGERFSRRQKKRQRIAERKALKAGVAGSKLRKKAEQGKL